MPCTAPSNRPATGPEVLETLPMVTLLDDSPTSLELSWQPELPLPPGPVPCVPWLPCVPCVPFVPWVPLVPPTRLPEVLPPAAVVPGSWLPVPVLTTPPPVSTAFAACLRICGSRRAPQAVTTRPRRSTNATVRSERMRNLRTGAAPLRGAA